MSFNVGRVFPVLLTCPLVFTPQKRLLETRNGLCGITHLPTGLTSRCPPSLQESMYSSDVFLISSRALRGGKSVLICWERMGRLLRFTCWEACSPTEEGDTQVVTTSGPPPWRGGSKSCSVYWDALQVLPRCSVSRQDISVRNPGKIQDRPLEVWKLLLEILQALGLLTVEHRRCFGTRSPYVGGNLIRSLTKSSLLFSDF